MEHGPDHSSLIRVNAFRILFSTKCSDRDLHHQFVELRLRENVTTHFSDIGKYCLVCCFCHYTKSSCFAWGRDKRVAVFYTAAEYFSQNKPSHHFLWNLVPQCLQNCRTLQCFSMSKGLPPLPS